MVGKRFIPKWLAVTLVTIPVVGLAIILGIFMSLGIRHDKDPQEYEKYITDRLGVQGVTYSVGKLKEYSLPQNGWLWTFESYIEPFQITYWNGNKVWMYAPPEVWEAVVTASKKYPWCSPILSLAVAHSESPHFVNYATENPKSAMGVWQFIRSTWAIMWPDPNNRPERTDIMASADAACRYYEMAGMIDALPKGMTPFIEAFALYPPVWNQHVGQAQYVWDAYQELGGGEFTPDSGSQTVQVNFKGFFGERTAKILQFFGLFPDYVAASGGSGGYDGSVDVTDPKAFRLPYDYYHVTNGPHGQSYGDLAVDLSAGQGAVIKSPINGVVTAVYNVDHPVDGYGNTMIYIENQKYKVKMLHGDYKVSPGDKVRIGEYVGKESNHGHVFCSDGNPPNGRNCGYHTHLNVFDKEQGRNIYPMDIPRIN